MRPRFWFRNATPLPWDFGPRETGSRSGGSQFSVRPAAHTQLGAVGLGSRLLGIPGAGTEPAALSLPASEAAPGPGLTSQGPTKRILAFSIADRRRQAHRSPLQRSQRPRCGPGGAEVAALIGGLCFHGDGAARGGRREWAGPGLGGLGA